MRIVCNGYRSCTVLEITYFMEHSEIINISVDGTDRGRNYIQSCSCVHCWQMGSSRPVHK